jgi:hypothetical protein
MFNLDQSIAEWRRQMMAGGIKTAEALDELENHLREDVEQQMRAGMDAEAAFEGAIQRIGQAGALSREFAKVGKTRQRRNLKNILLRLLGVPMAFSDDLTASARETLELGRMEALVFHHDFIGTEHVLLGLLNTETDIVPQVLKRMGISRELVRAEIGRIIGPGLQGGSAHALPYTPRVKKSLALASKEARGLKRHQIGAEHIFLGLLLEGGGVAALVLKGLGVSPDHARREILKELRLT